MSNPWLFTGSLRRFLSGRIMIGLMLASAGISLLGPSVASAHAEPQTANPPIDGAVRVAPERLEVWFVQEVFRRAGANALEVHDEAGERVGLDCHEVKGAGVVAYEVHVSLPPVRQLNPAAGDLLLKDVITKGPPIAAGCRRGSVP